MKRIVARTAGRGTEQKNVIECPYGHPGRCLHSEEDCRPLQAAGTCPLAFVT